MNKKKTVIFRYIFMLAAALLLIMAKPALAMAEEVKKTQYKVTVELYQRIDGVYENTNNYEVAPQADGQVHISIDSFNNDFDQFGFGTTLNKAEYDGVDVTNIGEIAETLDKDKVLKIYYETKYLMTYNFYNIDGDYISSKTDVCTADEMKAYKIEDYSIDDIGLYEGQTDFLKIHGYAMQNSYDDYIKPDPKTDTIYKPGETVAVDYAKRFNVIYEYGQSILLEYDFDGPYISPRSYPSSKYKAEVDTLCTFEKKPFSIKAGYIEGVDLFSENDVYVEPLSYEGYKFVGWKDVATGKIYDNGADFEITPPTEILLEPAKESLQFHFIALWEEEEEPEPEPMDYHYSDEWVDGKWYNADGTQTYDGIMSWKQNEKGWWLEDSKGWYPKSQWQKVDGKWYFFTEDGYMDYSEYREGCWLGADGAWDEHYFGGRWMQNSTGWWYEDSMGWYPSGQSLWIDGVKYWFKESGYWDGK